MRKVLQAILASGGVVAVGIALMLVFFGPSSIPGSAPVNATNDSEVRFYAVLFGFYGAILLWCIKDVERKGQYVRLLALILFVGGVARTISILAVGLPHPLFIALMIVEYVVPPAIVLMQSRVEQAVRLAS